MSANLRGLSTRQRILDVVQDAVLAKGFEATSIDEIVVAVAITKSGFSCHFPDKNARARDLTVDPLRAMLVGLKLLSELLGNIPGGHPGCLVGTACYQERLFDREVRALNRMAMLGWRKRFSAAFREIIETPPPENRRRPGRACRHAVGRLRRRDHRGQSGEGPRDRPRAGGCISAATSVCFSTIEPCRGGLAGQQTLS